MDFLRARWENLIMANYEIDPSVLQPSLPYGVEIDTYRSKAYISLVGFLFRETRLFNVSVPFLGTFEEINLRFYVVRKMGAETRRGVVFVNETVPFRPVVIVANWLYKEHYVAVPTQHEWKISDRSKEIAYGWQCKNECFQIKAIATNQAEPTVGSIEEYIFEHYYGYTELNDNRSVEYRVEHPRWQVNKVKEFEIKCDFAKMYGSAFGILNGAEPSSVIMAEGSAISVKWKRSRF